MVEVRVAAFGLASGCAVCAVCAVWVARVRVSDTQLDVSVYGAHGVGGPTLALSKQQPVGGTPTTHGQARYTPCHNQLIDLLLLLLLVVVVVVKRRRTTWHWHY